MAPFLAVVVAAGDGVAEDTVDATRAAVAVVADEVDLPIEVSLGTTTASQRDLVDLALDDGAALACVVGTDAVRTAAAVATGRPGARTCAIAEVGAPRSEVPEGLLALVPSDGEVAAAVAGAAVAVAPPDARVALVVADGRWRDVLAEEVQRRAQARATAEAEALAEEQAAEDGTDAGEPPPVPDELPEVPRVTTTVVADTLEGTALGRVLRDAPAWLAVTDDLDDVEGLRAGTGGGVLLAGPAAGPLPDDADDVLLAWSHDLRPALRLAVEAAQDDTWRPGTVVLGHADGALEVVAGGAELGPAARQAIEQLVEGFAELPAARLPEPRAVEQP